jgi:uncharacterized protein YciI
MSGLYLIIARDNDNALQKRLAERPTHLAHVESIGDRMKLAGPILNGDGGDPCGSFLLIEADSLQEAETFAHNDPFNKAGVFKSVTVMPWRDSVGAWLPTQR